MPADARAPDTSDHHRECRCSDASGADPYLREIDVMRGAGIRSIGGPVSSFQTSAAAALPVPH